MANMAKISQVTFSFIPKKLVIDQTYFTISYWLISKLKILMRIALGFYLKLEILISCPQDIIKVF